MRQALKGGTDRRAQALGRCRFGCRPNGDRAGSRDTSCYNGFSTWVSNSHMLSQNLHRATHTTTVTFAAASTWLVGSRQ